MSTGRRRLESDGPSRGSSRGKTSRGKPKQEGGSNQLLVGLGIGGGIVGVAALFFILGRSNATPPAPAPVAVAPAFPSTPASVPAAVPIPPSSSAVSSPLATVNATPMAAPVAGNAGALPGPVVQKTSDSVPTAAPTEIASATTAKLIPKASDEELKDLTLPVLVEQVDPAIVRLTTKTVSGGSLGSGFLVDDNGTVVTNYHVVGGSQRIEAAFENGDKVAAEGFYVLDQERDIAVLKIAIPAGKHRPVTLAKELPKKGTAVVAFGCPKGLDFSTTQGIVSGIRKPEFGKERLGNIATMIQTDTPISSGNSGGPLVNMKGEVVAMNTLGSIAGQNLNFSVSSLDIAELLAKKGTKIHEISPKAMPEEDTLVSFLNKFDDLSATERGRTLLAQIQEIGLVAWAFPLDPTDRINAYCMNHLTKAVEDKLKLKVLRSRGLAKFQPIIVCSFDWSLPEDFVRNGDIASNLGLRITVITRDVDKEGNEVIAIVYRDTAVVGTLSLGALADGKITKAMESNVPKFFDKFVSAMRKAKREAGASK